MSTTEKHAAGQSGAPSDLEAAQEQLGVAMDALRTALARMRDSEESAARRYAAATEEAMNRLRADLAMTNAELKASRADDKATLEQALREATEALKGRAEESRVRLHLGRLDAVDLGTQAWERVERAGQAVTTTLAEVRQDTTEFTQTLRERASSAIGSLRRALFSFNPAGGDDTVDEVDD